MTDMKQNIDIEIEDLDSSSTQALDESTHSSLNAKTAVQPESTSAKPTTTLEVPNQATAPLNQQRKESQKRIKERDTPIGNNDNYRPGNSSPTRVSACNANEDNQVAARENADDAKSDAFPDGGSFLRSSLRRISHKLRGTKRPRTMERRFAREIYEQKLEAHRARLAALRGNHNDDNNHQVFTADQMALARSCCGRFRDAMGDALSVLLPMRGVVRGVEKQFGVAYASFFEFVRWLFYINLLVFLIFVAFVFVPHWTSTATTTEAASTMTATTTTMMPVSTASTSNESTSLRLTSSSVSRVDAVESCSIKYVNKVGNDSIYANIDLNSANLTAKHIEEVFLSARAPVIDFLQGTGFMELTFLFYGNYRFI